MKLGFCVFAGKAAGLDFGAQFIPCYLQHPDVESAAMDDTSQEALAAAVNKYKLYKTFGSLAEILDSDRFDAVHLVTPSPVMPGKAPPSWSQESTAPAQSPWASPLMNCNP